MRFGLGRRCIPDWYMFKSPSKKTRWERRAHQVDAHERLNYVLIPTTGALAKNSYQIRCSDSLAWPQPLFIVCKRAGRQCYPTSIQYSTVDTVRTKAIDVEDHA